MSSHFRFTQTPPEEQLFDDIQQLNPMTKGQLSDLVDLIIAFLTEQSTDLLSDLDEFAEKYGMAPGSLKNVVRGLFYFFKEAIRSNLNPTYVKEDLENLGMSEEHAEMVSLKWKANFIRLSRSVMSHTLTVNGISDMKWRFGVTTSNTEKDKVGAAFMQFKFVLDKGNGNKENVHMEMTLPQFYEFVAQMEKAKSQLDFFG